MKQGLLRKQGGAAILLAMLTVVLVATLASAVLWQQWRGVEVETAERSRTQSSWVLIGALDWGLNAQQAIDLPNFGSFNGPTVLEAGRFPADTVAALKGRGHAIVETELPSGLQAIQRTPTGWFGGADPRREGVVMGQ